MMIIFVSLLTLLLLIPWIYFTNYLRHHLLASLQHLAASQPSHPTKSHPDP